ncbi:MAG: SRPBCC family protein [Actinomycetota bacterium]|nr:SRPBCC family protein [Actinomycetota bacterium]
MSRLSVAIDISAPPDQVWKVVEPVEDHVEWMHDAVAIRFQTDQHRGAGTEFLCDTKVGPIKLVDRMEITEWVPDSAMGVRHTGLVTGTGRFTLTPIDLGRRTRFSWDESLIFPWWLGGPIGASIGGRLVLRSIWKRNLRTLKRIVEASAGLG